VPIRDARHARLILATVTHVITFDFAVAAVAHVSQPFRILVRLSGDQR